MYRALGQQGMLKWILLIAGLLSLSACGGNQAVEPESSIASTGEVASAPAFAKADEVASLMFDDELVMGVAWDGEAKAYTVTVMRFREMVNDELGGIPTLVTW